MFGTNCEFPGTFLSSLLGARITMRQTWEKDPHGEYGYFPMENPIEGEVVHVTERYLCINFDGKLQGVSLEKIDGEVYVLQSFGP